MPLSSVLQRNGAHDVHLLHVDTEGDDYEVLKTVDLVRHRPLLIFAEHKHLSKEDKLRMVRMFRENGYSAEDCGGDYFALHKGLWEGLLRAA